MRRRTIHLSQEQRQELDDCLKHHPLPYMRAKAAALLKVAAGAMLKDVAAHQLNTTVCPPYISNWISRYEEDGLKGLLVQPGRGRKPSFFPSARP